MPINDPTTRWDAFTIQELQIIHAALAEFSRLEDHPERSKQGRGLREEILLAVGGKVTAERLAKEAGERS